MPRRWLVVSAIILSCLFWVCVNTVVVVPVLAFFLVLSDETKYLLSSIRLPVPFLP